MGIKDDNPLLLNSTQVPNIFLDKLMPVVSPALWKIISAMARQTYGWQRVWHNMSIRFLQRKTGLSNRSIVDGLKELISSAVVLQGKETTDGFMYSLNQTCDIDAAITALTPKKRKPRGTPSGGKWRGGGEPSSPGGVVNPVHQGGGEPSSPVVVNPVHQEVVNPVHQYKETLLKKDKERDSSPSLNEKSGFQSALEGLRGASASQLEMSATEQRDLLDARSGEGFNSIEVAHCMCVELVLAGQPNKIMLDEALNNYRAKNKAKTWEQCGEDLLALWAEYDTTVKGKFKKGIKSFFSDGVFMRRSEWCRNAPQPSTATSATNILAQRRQQLGDKGKEHE